MTKTATFWNSVLHGVIQGIIWLVPPLILALGNYGDMTVSGVLSAIAYWLHNKYAA